MNTRIQWKLIDLFHIFKANRLFKLRYFYTQLARFIAMNVIRGPTHDVRIHLTTRHCHEISHLWWLATVAVLKWCDMQKRVSSISFCCLNLLRSFFKLNSQQHTRLFEGRKSSKIPIHHLTFFSNNLDCVLRSCR